jgi:hypothetical protein
MASLSLARPAARRVLFVVAALLGALLVAWTASAVVPPNLPRATEAQRTLAARHPGDAGAQVDLGNLLLLGGATTEAEAAYLRALEIEPGHAAAHFNLGLLLQGRGETGRALREFRRTLESDPRHAWAHYQIGTIEAGRGFESLAVRSYAQAFALDPRLRFPDVNPHVIDNPLTTRAMLQAYRLRMTSTLATPDFDDPVRVASLLIQGGDSETAAAATAPTPAAPRVDPRSASNQPPTVGEGAPRLDTPNHGQAPAFTRTIGADELRQSSRSGQAMGAPGPAPGASYRAPPRTPIYEPAPEPDEGEPVIDSNPDENVGGNPGRGLGPGFRPGTQSTGRLEMKLLPATADRA